MHAGKRFSPLQSGVLSARQRSRAARRPVESGYSTVKLERPTHHCSRELRAEVSWEARSEFVRDVGSCPPDCCKAASPRRAEPADASLGLGGIGGSGSCVCRWHWVEVHDR